MIELDNNAEFYSAKLKVVGVGGGGGNAINSMIERGLHGCDFIAVNTDVQALMKNHAPEKVQVGKELTRGLGAGANPEIGKGASEEDREELSEVLAGSDMVFVTAGMGGGTGTGGAPIVAQVARELGALVVGIVTRPFNWEGKPRRDKADSGIEELREQVDTLIVVPNQKLLSIIDKNTSLQDAFQKVDDVLYNATSGIARIITGQGYINVDFADVRTIMQNMGEALMGTGSADGDDRAVEAAQNAISSPLLEGISIEGSQGVLINIAASSSLTMMEIDEAVEVVYKAVGEDANIIFGVVLDEELQDRMMVTVIATGFNKEAKVAKRPAKDVTAMPFQKRGYEIPKTEEVARTSTEEETVVNDPRAEEQSDVEEYVANSSNAYRKYDEPAYNRRKVVHRGGFDIPRQTSEPEENVSKDKEEEETAQRVERAAFLRRIMD